MFFIHVETVSWKGLPQAVTLFMLGAAGFQILSLDTLSTSVLFVLCSVNQFYFINKDKFKSLKPTWGESSPSPQTNTRSLGHHCHLGLAVGCFVSVPGLYPRDTEQPSPKRCPDLTGVSPGLACPWWEPPGRCCPGGVCFSPSWAS